MAGYAKLRNGDWGIRVDGPVRAGQRITVTKRDGTAKTETVGAIVWSGDGVTLATIARGKRGGRDPRKCAECHGPLDDFDRQCGQTIGLCYDCGS